MRNRNALFAGIFILTIGIISSADVSHVVDASKSPLCLSIRKTLNSKADRPQNVKEDKGLLYTLGKSLFSGNDKKEKQKEDSDAGYSLPNIFRAFSALLR